MGWGDRPHRCEACMSGRGVRWEMARCLGRPDVTASAYGKKLPREELRVAFSPFFSLLLVYISYAHQSNVPSVHYGKAYSSRQRSETRPSLVIPVVCTDRPQFRVVMPGMAGARVGDAAPSNASLPAPALPELHASAAEISLLLLLPHAHARRCRGLPIHPRRDQRAARAAPAAFPR